MVLQHASFHPTNPNQEILMHRGQDSFLPRPTVGKGDDSNIRNYNEFTNIARDDLFRCLTAAMEFRARVAPGCLVKVSSCYHRKI